MVTAAEVAHVYHTVKHNLSYNSSDCQFKLTVQTLPDSAIAKKMSCGRRKAEAVVTDVLTLFEEMVKKLERDATTSADLYAIMDSFLKRLIKRKDDKFYGYLTRQKLQPLSPHAANRVRQEFTAFLDTAIGYVRKWFNFSEDNWHFHVQPLCLTSGKISYDDMETIIEKLHLVDRLNLSMDELYDE